MTELTGEWSCTVKDSADNAVLLPAPLEWEIVKSLDSPAHSFEGIFPCARACGDLRSVEVKIGGRTLFSGRPDEAAVTEDADGRRLKLIARSIGAVLLDNEALPQTYTTGLSLTELFDEHIRPYGFSTLITDFDVFFNQYQILKGTSEWEALSNFFRNGSQGIARIDDAGRVVCKMNPGEGSFHRISNRDAGAQRYTCLKITDNRYSPITRFVIRDDDGAYSYAYNNPEASALGLVRKRYLIPSVEYTLTPTGGQIDAMLRIRRSMLGKRVVTVTCPGLLDISVCDTASVSGGYETFEGLLVHQVRHRLASSGAVDRAHARRPRLPVGKGGRIMDALLIDGGHLCDSLGSPVMVGGERELLQRAAIRLAVRRGSLPHDPAFGSTLHRLDAGRPRRSPRRAGRSPTRAWRSPPCRSSRSARRNARGNPARGG